MLQLGGEAGFGGYDEEDDPDNYDENGNYLGGGGSEGESQDGTGCTCADDDTDDLFDTDLTFQQDQNLDGFDLINEESTPELLSQLSDDAIGIFVAFVNQQFQQHGPDAMKQLFDADQFQLYHDVAGCQPFLCTPGTCPRVAQGQ